MIDIILAKTILKWPRECLMIKNKRINAKIIIIAVMKTININKIQSSQMKIAKIVGKLLIIKNQKINIY